MILGCGGHGRVVLDILRHLEPYELVGFVDSNPDMQNRRIDGLSVLGKPDELHELRDRLSIDVPLSPSATTASGASLANDSARWVSS